MALAVLVVVVIAIAIAADFLKRSTVYSGPRRERSDPKHGRIMW